MFEHSSDKMRILFEMKRKRREESFSWAPTRRGSIHGPGWGFPSTTGSTATGVGIRPTVGSLRLRPLYSPSDAALGLLRGEGGFDWRSECCQNHAALTRAAEHQAAPLAFLSSPLLSFLFSGFRPSRHSLPPPRLLPTGFSPFILTSFSGVAYVNIPR